MCRAALSLARGTALLLCLSLAAAPPPCLAAGGEPPPPADPELSRARVQGEYLVTTGDDPGPEAVARAMSGLSVTGTRRLDPGLYQVNLEPDPGPDAVRRKVEEARPGWRVQPNYVYSVDPPGKTRPAR
jgi:hypothetical protein